MHSENAIRKKMIMDNEYNKNLKTLEQLIKEYNKINVYENIDEKYEEALTNFINNCKIIINDSSNNFESITTQTSLNYSVLDASSNAVETFNAVETSSNAIETSSNAVETSNAKNDDEWEVNMYFDPTSINTTKSIDSTNIITNIMNMTSFKMNVVLFALAYLCN